MWKMSAFQLGVLLFALCLTTQVMSQNLTEANTTMSSNVTSTQSPSPHSSSSNATTPAGAGVGLQAGAGALLAPVLIALHRLC